MNLFTELRIDFALLYSLWFPAQKPTICLCFILRLIGRKWSVMICISVYVNYLNNSKKYVKVTSRQKT